MKDSANVADLISQGKCLFYEHPAHVLRDLRSLLSLKRKFKKIEHGFRVRIRNQVLKTAGWDLSANRSGKRSDSVIPVISKRGKSDLRYALYQAALIASTRNKHFTSWFIEKLKGREKEKGIKTKMRLKLAAKLLIIVYPVKCLPS